MPLKRYNRSDVIAGGTRFGTSEYSVRIYQAVQQGRVQVIRHLSKEGERLDIMAGKMYDDATLWWVIAAASGIGWGLQVPPGTVISIPTDMGQIQALVG